MLFKLLGSVVSRFSGVISRLLGIFDRLWRDGLGLDL